MKLNPTMMASGRTYRGPSRAAPRSHGVHVSAINKSLGIAAGKLSDDEADDFPFERFSDTSYPLLPALGVAWEEFRATHYNADRMVWQPYELFRDGIYGTPDGVMFTPEGDDIDCFWECKYSTKKIQPIADLWMYVKQGLTYCAMSEATLSQWVRRVQYDICFALGDYSRPYQPIGTVTKVEFEPREINAWWDIVVKESKNVRPE